MRFLGCEENDMEILINIRGVKPRNGLQFELNDKTNIKLREQKDSVNIHLFRFYKLPAIAKFGT